MTFRQISGACGAAVLIATAGNGTRHWVRVAVQKDSATGEYRARIMEPSFMKNPAADYFTNDMHDAYGTAAAMAKSIWTTITESGEGPY